MSSIIITPITYMNMKIVYLLNNTRRIYRMLVNADKAPLLTHTHTLFTHIHAQNFTHDLTKMM